MLLSIDDIPELSLAYAAARAGGDVVAEYFRSGIQMRGKQSYNLVSDADLESERIIVRMIQDRFPEHAILSEEEHAETKVAEHLWVVDPLDGTNNFAHQVPQFSVSIAYWHQGLPCVGVVLDPLRNVGYVAARGRGAFLGDKRLQVARHSRLDETLIGVGFYYDRGTIMERTLLAVRDLFHQNIHGIRRFGSAALDLCWVAEGKFGAFFEFQLSPWDFGAGVLILQEAGGRITTCLGEPLPLKKTSVLASNGLLHQAMLDTIIPHFSGS